MRKDRGFGLCCALLLALPAHAAVTAPPKENTAQHYQQCVAAVSRNAEEALKQALSWKDHGGGAAAEHCAALALIALKRPAEAAVYLDNIAREATSSTPRERAALLDQAGNAWLLAGVPGNADSMFTAALTLTPNDVDVLIDRASARALAKDWAGAEADLTRAYALNRTNPEILVLRSSARAALGRGSDARADIDAALALDPTYPDALVERGAMKLAAGDKDGARADWQQVTARAPSSEAGNAARKYLADLDAPTPATPSPLAPAKPVTPPAQPPANAKPHG